MRTVLLWRIAASMLIGLARSVSAQAPAAPLTGMPRELEIEYALSALPPHLRAEATVYVLDLGKGYVVAKAGTNGFTCFVARTEYSREHFANNLFVPVGYDAEGAKTYMPVYFAVARLRIEGKLSPGQVKQAVLKGLADNTYRSPARAGVAYMVAPVMTAYRGPGSREVMTMSMPHLMFYAPNLMPADVGAAPPRGTYPYMLDQGPLGYIIVNIGSAEKARLIDDSRDLLRALCTFRSELCIDR